MDRRVAGAGYVRLKGWLCGYEAMCIYTMISQGGHVLDQIGSPLFVPFELGDFVENQHH